MMSGDMTDLCAIRGKIVELWNVRDGDERSKIATVFYQLYQPWAFLALLLPPWMKAKGFQTSADRFRSSSLPHE